MTLARLQALVRMLSNASWCRYFTHWNYPQTEPWQMAICCVEFRLAGAFLRHQQPALKELAEMGFKQESLNGLTYYVIDRTNEDGTPFRSDGA